MEWLHQEIKTNRYKRAFIGDYRHQKTERKKKKKKENQSKLKLAAVSLYHRRQNCREKEKELTLPKRVAHWALLQSRCSVVCWKSFSWMWLESPGLDRMMLVGSEGVKKSRRPAPPTIAWGILLVLEGK